jgi:hypothetical protein
VVLDHDDAVAVLHQPLQRAHQQRHVGGVQPGGRLVEEVQVTARLARAGEVARQLQALRLAAGQRRRRLRQGQVAEPDL